MNFYDNAAEVHKAAENDPNVGEGLALPELFYMTKGGRPMASNKKEPNFDPYIIIRLLS